MTDRSAPVSRSTGMTSRTPITKVLPRTLSLSLSLSLLSFVHQLPAFLIFPPKRSLLPFSPPLVPFPRILHPLRDHPFFFLPNSPVANSRVQLQQNLNTSEFSTPVDRKIPPLFLEIIPSQHNPQLRAGELTSLVTAWIRRGSCCFTY